MSELSFVPVTQPEQIAELANFAEDIFRDYFGQFHTPEKVDTLVKRMLSIETLITAIADEGYEYYFVDGEEGHVGFVSVKAEEAYLYLSKFYLAASARGKGYARQMFAFVKQRMEACGKSAIRLNVARDNEGSIKVYEHFGFKTIESTDTEVAGGIFMNDYVMEWAA